MAGILSLSRRQRHEPLPRIWHTSCQIDSNVVVLGGVTNEIPRPQRTVSVVDIFDLYTESWQQKEVTGKAPAPGVYRAASVSVEDDLFTFGGFDGKGSDGSEFYNALHKLKGGSQWIEVCRHDRKAGFPMAKYGAMMVAYGDNLAVFGGYGIPHHPIQPGSSFESFVDGEGWTNEFHIYNVKEDVWISPDITGERPPPSSNSTLTSIESRRAVLFRGDDVYIIDLLNMHWTKQNKSGDGPWPEERSGHAACCLNYGQQHPQLLVTGGMNETGKILGDAWVLDVDSGRWRKVSGTLQPRWAHSTTAFCLVDGVTEVTMFGGSADPRSLSDERISKLGCSGQSEWELVSVTPFSKLGSEERLSLKKIQREQRERQKEAGERVLQAKQQDARKGEGVRQRRY